VARNYRQVVDYLTPAWLREGEGGAILYVLNLLLDVSSGKLRAGLEARFPSRAGESAAALIGQDRGLLRGRTETLEHYAARLAVWRYPRGHRVRGSAFALLTQLREYFGGGKAWSIDASGTRHDIDSDGVESYSYGGAWTWDSVAASEWGRFWVGLASDDLSEQPSFDDPDLWGSAIGNPNYTIGVQGLTTYDVTAIRGLLMGRAWKPAGTVAEWLILLDGTPTTDATYAQWSKTSTGVRVAARDSAFRYVSLDPDRNNTYAGDPTDYAAEVTMPDGSTYVGDATNWHATITMPDGSTYTPDSSVYDTQVLLPDDGSIP
jgi:hypothetical protein